MQFMLLIHGDESRMNSLETDDTGIPPDYQAFNQALVKAGAMRGGERLRPTSAATTVRVRDKKAVVLVGPYAETQEQLGATTSSTSPLSTRRSTGRANARPHSSARSRSARSGPRDPNSFGRRQAGSTPSCLDHPDRPEAPA